MAGTDRSKRPKRGMPAFLLCGGSARRLSFSKEMLRVDGAPLAVKLLERLSAVSDTVSVVTNRPEYLSVFVDAPTYRDEHPGKGPLAGIHAALKNSRADRSLFLACDMPLVHIDMLENLLAHAEAGDADAVVARGKGKVQPLLGIYHSRILPRLEAVLEEGRSLSLNLFLESLRVDFVDFEGDEAKRLRDIDTVADFSVLSEEFADVEPLPVREAPMVRVGGDAAETDVVAEEWPVAVMVNGTRLATVMCLPVAIRELAYGFLRYLGLAKTLDEIEGLTVDYRGRRVTVEMDVSRERLGAAVQLLVTSTCGANVYGGRLPELHEVASAASPVVTRAHLLECIKGLRAMSPVFERTGCTHQAAFTDGKRILYFFEDIGRHNAVDKIVGAAMLGGRRLSHGAIVTTGRLNSEMVVKALRAEAPVLASRSAATTNAVKLAENFGLTLVGFARAARLNVYTHPERVSPD